MGNTTSLLGHPTVQFLTVSPKNELRGEAENIEAEGSVVSD